MFPIKLEIRKLPILPIVEVKVKSQPDFKVDRWIIFPLTIIELGIAMGGKLISEEPRQKLEANTIFFAMIFETEKKTMDFIKSLQNR